MLGGSGGGEHGRRGRRCAGARVGRGRRGTSAARPWPWWGGAAGCGGCLTERGGRPGGCSPALKGRPDAGGYATAGRGGSDGERRWRRGVVGEEDGDGCIPAVRRRQRGRRATGAASAGVGLRGGRGGGLTDELRGVGGSPQARACSPGSRGAAVDATETARHRHGSGGGGGHRSTRGLRRGEQGEGRPDPRRGLRDPSISGEEAAWRGRRGLRATTDGIGRVQGEWRCRGTSGAMRDRGRGRCPRSRSRKQREACGETRGGSGERGEYEAPRLWSRCVVNVA